MTGSRGVFLSLKDSPISLTRSQRLFYETAQGIIEWALQEPGRNAPLVVPPRKGDEFPEVDFLSFAVPPKAPDHWFLVMRPVGGPFLMSFRWSFQALKLLCTTFSIHPETIARLCKRLKNMRVSFPVIREITKLIPLKERVEFNLPILVDWPTVLLESRVNFVANPEIAKAWTKFVLQNSLNLLEKMKLSRRDAIVSDGLETAGCLLVVNRMIACCDLGNILAKRESRKAALTAVAQKCLPFSHRLWFAYETAFVDPDTFPDGPAKAFFAATYGPVRQCLATFQSTGVRALVRHAAYGTMGLIMLASMEDEALTTMGDVGTFPQEFQKFASDLWLISPEDSATVENRRSIVNQIKDITVPVLHLLFAAVASLDRETSAPAVRAVGLMFEMSMVDTANGLTHMRNFIHHLLQLAKSPQTAEFIEQYANTVHKLLRCMLLTFPKWIKEECMRAKKPEFEIASFRNFQFEPAWEAFQAHPEANFVLGRLTLTSAPE